LGKIANEKRGLEDLDVDGKIILKLFIEKQKGRLQAEFT
jgi:hypothetical protein